MNKNVQNTMDQINNTLGMLNEQNVIRFTNPCEYFCDQKENTEQITWKNHVSGRAFCGKAFTTIKQYTSILSSNSYQALLNDYSIIRCSFIFMENEIISQNLLWWPCPVKMDPEYEEEFGLVESVQDLIKDSTALDVLQMRTPIRIDFDAKNNTALHPRAHITMQHHESRMNSNKPICFNTFMRFILENYYPDLELEYKKWNYLRYQYENKNKTIEYVKKSQLVF